MNPLIDKITILTHQAPICGICAGLGITEWFGGPDFICVVLKGKQHTLPSVKNRLWRRVWRRFLLDHVNELPPIQPEASGDSRDVQSCGVS